MEQLDSVFERDNFHPAGSRRVHDLLKVTGPIEIGLKFNGCNHQFIELMNQKYF
jgi:hypothetical protein